MSELRTKQLSVVTHIAIGVLGVALVLGGTFLLFPAPELPAVADRLAFALRCAPFSALTLLAGIGVVALSRFGDTAAMDPSTSGPAQGKLAVPARYLDNTLQQPAG